MKTFLSIGARGQWGKPSIQAIAVFVLLICGTLARADDPGITKVRLIQISDSVYHLEADVAQLILPQLGEPVFPERFRMTELSAENQSGWITLKFTFVSSSGPLIASDIIFLPWNRNGVDVTAVWSSGDSFKGFFTKSLGGIQIDLGELMWVEKTTMEVFSSGFWLGINHFGFKWVHILLLGTLVIVMPKFRALAFLLWFSFGQSLSMVLLELNVSGFDLLLSELGMVLIMLLLAYVSLKKRELGTFRWLLLIVGVLHGLSVANELSALEITSIQRIQGLFAFNLATDVCQYTLAVVLIVLMKRISPSSARRKQLRVLSGGLAIFLLLVLFQEHVVVGKTDILRISDSGSQSYENPKGARPSARQVQRGTGLMTTPIVTYLSIEPYEIRQEILVQARAGAEILGMVDETELVIPVSFQPEFKQVLADSVAQNTTLQIDGGLLEPVEVFAHFVTLNRGGVTLRANPIDESLEEGIVGVTLVYEPERFPDSARVSWDLFPGLVTAVEASAIDPHGALTVLLTSQDNIINWKSRLAGYRTADIETVFVTRPATPWISIGIWLILGLFILFQLRDQVFMNRKHWIVGVMAMGFICYPFVRSEADVSLISSGKPDEEKAGIIIEDLLANVYRAFDRRNESDVYDQLARTVSGDQLTDIYMQNRQSLAMENRGGARARVEEVTLEEIYNIEKSGQGGFTADVLWRIRGSVNHFGHTHYRQNQYRALITTIDVDGAWKISHIETIDERRLY